MGSALHGVLPPLRPAPGWLARLRVRGRRLLRRPVRTRFRCGSPLAWPRRRPRLAGSFFNRHAVTALWPLRLLVGARFQALFHSPPGVLFTFPSRYLSAVGHGGVLSLGGWSPLLPAGFHVPGGTLVARAQGRRFAYGALTLWRPASRPVRLAPPFVTGRGARGPPARAPQPRRGNARALVSARRFGLAPFRSPLLGGSLLDFLSSGYLDVSVPPVAEPSAMCSPRAETPSRLRFPHSETPGSKAVCASPGTIAACRVLRRLPVPRHPPRARDTPALSGRAPRAHDVPWPLKK